MKILLTGGSGFIGSHVCRELLTHDHEVAVLHRGEAPWRLSPSLGKITSIRGGLENQGPHAGDPLAGSVCDHRT